MQKSKHILYFLGALFFMNLNSAQAQQDTTKKVDPYLAGPTNHSLNGQYNFLLAKSKSYYGSKLINPSRLAALWKSVNDTLVKERRELAKVKSDIKSLNENILGLKTEVSGKETTLASANAMVNEVKFLGLSFDKNIYNTLVWSIIILLAGGLAFVIFQTGKFKHEAVYRTQLYQEVADEFQAHKVKAKDKEMKLARELQDERNKWDDAKGK